MLHHIAIMTLLWTQNNNAASYYSFITYTHRLIIDNDVIIYLSLEYAHVKNDEYFENEI